MICVSTGLVMKPGTLDITRDMTRQYKGMQEELLNRINQLEGTIQVCIDRGIDAFFQAKAVFSAPLSFG